MYTGYIGMPIRKTSNEDIQAQKEQKNIPASTPNKNDGITVNSNTSGNLEAGKGHLGSHRN